MGMSAGGSRSVQSEINITPLVDVVLVLLIIFMVATPVLQMGIDVEVPPKVEVSGPPPEDLPDQLVVTVRSDGAYLNASKAGTLAELRDMIAPHMSNRSKDDRIVFINAEDQTAFGSAVEVLDTIRAAGAVKIGFLTDPPETPAQ